MNPQSQELIESNLSLLKKFKNPDLQQEAFFGLREAALRFNGKGNFIPFARRIIKFRIVDHLRNSNFSRRRGARDKGNAKQLFFTNSPQDIPQSHEFVSQEKHFQELLESFPISEDDKKLLTLYFIKNFTFRQIGEVFEIGESAVCLRLKKIIQTLKEYSQIERIKNDCFTH